MAYGPYSIARVSGSEVTWGLMVTVHPGVEIGL